MDIQQLAAASIVIVISFMLFRFATNIMFGRIKDEEEDRTPEQGPVVLESEEFEVEEPEPQPEVVDEDAIVLDESDFEGLDDEIVLDESDFEGL